MIAKLGNQETCFVLWDQKICHQQKQCVRMPVVKKDANRTVFCFLDSCLETCAFHREAFSACMKIQCVASHFLDVRTEHYRLLSTARYMGLFMSRRLASFLYFGWSLFTVSKPSASRVCAVLLVHKFWTVVFPFIWIAATVVLFCASRNGILMCAGSMRACYAV